MFSKKKRRFSKKKRKQTSADPTTRKLVERGVMSLPHDEGIYQAHKKTKRPPFSFLSGVKYVTILSILLWWLPTLGQMIAGYVGGRKTGSAWKGVLAACIPVAIIFSFSFMASNGILTNEIHFVASLPAMAANSVADAVPVLEPYIHFIMGYLTAFVAALGATFSVGLNGYLVTIIFAYIGGIVGQQVKRELELRASRPMVAMPPAYVSAPKQIARDNMRKSNTWWGKHPEKLKEMQRIPVRTVAKKSTKAAAPKTKPKPVAKPTPKKAKQASKGKTPQRELGKKGYDKNTVSKRLVERALGRYQRR